MRAALSLALAALAAHAAPQALWTAYSGYPTCYRQPILIQTPAALVALVEGRPGIPYCSGTFYPDTPAFVIQARTSTDLGATWLPYVNVTFGNIDFLTAVYDPASLSIILLVQNGDSGVVQTRSFDDGRTWSPTAVVTVAAPAGLYASLIPGVGHGLVISPARCLDASCGGTARRIVMPFVATRVGPVSNDTACGSCATALVLSDDGGASWYLGAVSDQNGSREAALAQFDSGAYGVMTGVVYANERNLGNATGVRLHALSTDGGLTFASEGVDAGLPDVVTGNWTGVVSGLARFDAPPAPPALVFSAPAAVGARANLSTWVSRDMGATWAGSSVLWPGPAAYSDALQIDAARVAFVFEGGADEFAGGIFFTTQTMA